jgi:hypothetical protein
MRTDRRFLSWGVFLLALGAVALAARQGLIDAAAIRDAWQLWPVALIVLGLALVAGRTGWGSLAGIVAAAIFGLVAGLVLASGVPAGLGFCGGDGRGPVETSEATGTFGESATVELEFACGELVIVPGAGRDWTFAKSGTDGPELSAGQDRLRIETANRGPFFGDTRRSWRVTLPAHMDLGLSTTVDAGTGRLDLSGIDLRSLSLTGNAAEIVVDASKASVASFSASANAGKLVLTLPEAGSMDGSISANAGAVELCVADGVGLAVESSESLGSTNLAEAGLTKQGDRWRNAAYDTATDRIELHVSVNAGSLTLNPEGGCQ